jgi:poly(A) polymerase
LTAKQLVAALSRRLSRDETLRQIEGLSSDLTVPVWLVGGYVRDLALGLPTGDIDLIAGKGCPAFARALARLWGTRPFRVRRRGVTTWRLAVHGRSADIVDAASRGVDADLLRRELTVNAIAFELGAQRLVDPLGGLVDLRAGLLRAPRSEALAEDPVRAVRLARMVAHHRRFRIHRETRRQALLTAPAAARAPVERVREELDKLLAAASPRAGLDSFVSLGLLESVLPELAPLRHCAAGHQRPDVWTHTLDAISLTEEAGRRRLPGWRAITSSEDRRLLRWTLLLHDIAKPETLTIKSGQPAFHGHEVLGRRRGEALQRRLKVPKQRRSRIGRLILLHLRPGHLADAGATRRGLSRLVRDAGSDLPLLVLHAACDARASGGPDAPSRWRRLRRVLSDLLELGEASGDPPPTRLVDGHDVMRRCGLDGGPEVGQLLDAVADLQAEGRIRTRAEALAFLDERGSRGR